MKSECPVLNDYFFLEKDFNPRDFDLNIMALNIRSYKKHMKDICMDRGFMNSDVILLCETRTRPDDRQMINLSGYALKYCSGSNQLNASNGQMCFVRDELADDFTFLDSNTSSSSFTYNSSDVIELCAFRYFIKCKNASVFIIYDYKHPKKSNHEAYKELKAFVIKNVKNKAIEVGKTKTYKLLEKCIILGDFNMNYMNDKDSQQGKKLINKFNFKMCISIDKFNSTHEEGSLIDWALENSDEAIVLKTCVYEIYYSDHKALWLSIDANNNY